MLPDPLEEQFDLSATLVERTDGQRWQGELVGQEDQPLAALGVLEADAPQVVRALLAAVEAIERDGLVAEDPVAAIGGRRLHSAGIEVGFGADDEEAAGLMEDMQPLEIVIAAIYHVEGPRLGQEARNVFQG